MRVRTGRARISLVALLIASGAHSTAAQSGAFGGTVFRDTANHTLQGAEIMIGALNRRTVSDDSGNFRFGALSAGRYEVVVRRVGFRPLSDTVVVSGNALVERDYEMTADAVQLDSVRVYAASKPRASFRLTEFLERKHSNNGGHFIDESELRKHDARKLQDVISSYVPGIRRFRPLPVTRPSMEYLSSGRNGCNGPVFSCRGDDTPCPLSLFVDGLPVFTPATSGKDASNYPDMDRFVTADYAGVEVYPSAASAPAQYNAAAGDCGVLLLWTRSAVAKR